MTAAIPIPSRLLALLGVAVLALLALLVVRPLLSGGDDTATGTTTPPALVQPAAQTPVKPATTPAKPAQPVVKLLDGLPVPVANRLRHSRVVVVSVYSGTSSQDRAAMVEAKKGAHASGAGFTSLNVLDEKAARQLQAFAGGTVPTPSVLIVRRPGKVVARFDALVDSALVEQAAHNAGARGGK